MKKIGISVFSGMEQSVEQNIEYLKLAKSLGYAKMFTSLHIPEADYRTFLAGCRKVLDEAMSLGFEVTADVAPRSWALLAIEPADLIAWGIHTIRADYGFSPEKIRKLADDSPLTIEVNASTMTGCELTELLSTGMDSRTLCAGHNYYPRPDTGLSFELFLRRSEFFKAKDISVSVFIPGMRHPRGPIFAGLPTVEAHRRMTAVEASRQFWASDVVDTVFFGDPLVSGQELAAVAALPREVSDLLALRVTAVDLTKEEAAIAWLPRHTNRFDAAGMVVRSRESRELCSQAITPRVHLQVRRRGDVTIDNSQYGRYMGELQIALQDLPVDERVNIIGRIVDDDVCLLDCLTPGRAFCLKELKMNDV